MGEVSSPTHAPPDPVAAPPTGVDIAAFTLAYLQTHEAECPACGYNVHRLTEPRCPECGRKLALQIVSTVGGFTVPWIVMLVTFGLAAGIGLLTLCAEVRIGFADYRYGPAGMAVVLSYFIANLPVPPLLVKMRLRFIRMSLAVQYALMGLGLVTTTGMLTWLVLLVAGL